MGLSSSDSLIQIEVCRNESNRSENKDLFDFHSIANKQKLVMQLQYGKSYSQQLIQGLFLFVTSDRRLTIRQIGGCQGLGGCWRVGKTEYLQEGDLVKLGRMQFKIKELQIQRKRNQPIKSTVLGPSRIIDCNHSRIKNSGSESHVSNKLCRVCYTSTATISNPLFSLCECAGSVQFIHYQCVKSWFQRSLHKQQTQYYTSYEYSKLECDLCFKQIDYEMICNDVYYNLLDIEKYHRPYLIIEQNNVKKKKVKTYIIRLNQGTVINVGRSNTNHIVIKDISVSNQHCKILYSEHRLSIINNDSQYGTMVRMNDKKQYDYTFNKVFSLLRGKYLINIYLNKQSNVIDAFCFAETVYDIEACKVQFSSNDNL